VASGSASPQSSEHARVRKRARILAWLAQQGWERVTEARAAELAAAFPDVSAHTQRAALLESGLPLDALVAGVVQDNYDHLEASLLALLGVYERNAARHAAVRAVVIQAREHAELAVHNAHTHREKREEKIEMSLWLHTWLENPPLFPAWVELRKRRLSANADATG